MIEVKGKEEIKRIIGASCILKSHQILNTVILESHQSPQEE